MTSHGSISGALSNYSRLRTLPAMLSVAFVMASLYQFGGISPFTLEWIDYTIEPQHAVVVSLAILGVAFASSETKQLDNYEDWEMVVIAAGPVLIVAHHFVDFVSNEFAASDPLLPIIGFAVTVVSWGVAVR